jgi:hypothetical protein
MPPSEAASWKIYVCCGVNTFLLITSFGDCADVPMYVEFSKRLPWITDQAKVVLTLANEKEL